MRGAACAMVQRQDGARPIQQRTNKFIMFCMGTSSGEVKDLVGPPGASQPEGTFTPSLA